MKVVILAAGMGSRLGDPNLPKPLTPLISGRSILDTQLENLKACFSTDDIILVVGYRKESIMDAHPELAYVYNNRYATENTAKSLWKALRKVHEDVLWINGDVVFHPSILKPLLDENRTCMVVNSGKVGEEEVKYRTDDQGRIVEVSKQVANAQGEALGINLFKGNDAMHLCDYLERCHDKDYFEKGIETAIQEGMTVWSHPIDAALCTEVDFPEDLEKANKMIKKWKIPAAKTR